MRTSTSEVNGPVRCLLLGCLMLTATCSSFGPDLVVEGRVAVVQNVPGTLSLSAHAVSAETLQIFGKIQGRQPAQGRLTIRLKDGGDEVLATTTARLSSHRRGRRGGWESHFSVTTNVESRRVAVVEVSPAQRE